MDLVHSYLTILCGLLILNIIVLEFPHMQNTVKFAYCAKNLKYHNCSDYYPMYIIPTLSRTDNGDWVARQC